MAFENDERDERDGFEHRPSLGRAADEPAADVVIGGPSRFRVGMTGSGISSLRGEGELRNRAPRYTSTAASTRPPTATMLDETRTSLSVSDRVEAAYGANYKLLSFLALRRFRIPEDEVCAVIHDVFVAFIRSAEKIRSTPEDERAWLVGAVCNASRYYWRKHGKTSALTADDQRRIQSDRLSDDSLDRIELASVLRDLPAHCRDLLCRHYGEGYTAGEIAPAYALRPSSTSNLISKCLFAARAAFTRRRGR